ncbi:MAG: DUF4870 domain-containing protein [Proteobacteria bacterium]|nr:DUF4870 domain-containing protein [Pseudomonadota bacterium]
MEGPAIADPTVAATAPTESERTWGMLAHLAALAGLVLPLLGNVLGPLAVYLTRKDPSAFVSAHAREALNFNITVSLASILCGILALLYIGFALGVLLFIAWLVLTLIAAIRASEGALYHYPVTLRLVK